MERGVGRRAFLGAAGAALAGAGVSSARGDVPEGVVTTVLLVRHAEKAGPGGADPDDPALTERGRRRAAAMGESLRDAGVAAVFTTGTRRTRETAHAVAARCGVGVHEYSARSAPALVERVMREWRGRVVVVVGHSNTLGGLSAAFGGEDFGELAEEEYDLLAVVTVGVGAGAGAGANGTVRLRLGG